MNQAMAQLAEKLSIDHAKLPREELAEVVCEKALDHLGSKAKWQAEALEELAISILDEDPYKGEDADTWATISAKGLRLEAEAILRKERIALRKQGATNGD